MALQPEGTWLGRYTLDFTQLIESGREFSLSWAVRPCLHVVYDAATAANTVNDTGKDDREENEDPDRPIFSLVTGKYRQARRFGVRGTALFSFYLDRLLPQPLKCVCALTNSWY